MTDQKHKTPRVCKNCACFDPAEMRDGITTFGKCRSDAPRLDISRATTEGVWPTVGVDDWCINGFKAALVPKRIAPKE